MTAVSWTFISAPFLKVLLEAKFLDLEYFLKS